MTPSTRAFLFTTLAALVAAALLHLLVLYGVDYLWPAMIHLALFGWITGMIISVNYHTMPVFAARDFPHPRLLWAHWATFTTGITLATAGLVVSWDLLTTAGLLVQLGAALLFVANTVLLFIRGPRRSYRPPVPPVPDQPRVDRLGTQATKSAGLALPLALLLLLLVRLDWLSGNWLLAGEHLATLGWVMLMIVGVAYHVLPRFSGRGVRSPAWARAQILCHQAALILIVPALGLQLSLLFAAAGVLMTAAISLFAWTIWPALHGGIPRPALVHVTPKERPS